MNENYVSTQISVYKTNKVLVEFMDKLRAAPVNNYAHLHASGDLTDENGRKLHSLIGINMLDYSKGKGDKAIAVSANISPDEAMYIHSRICAGFPVFDFSQDKIFGNPDEQGYSKVTKLRILRNPQDNKGNPRKYPWYMEVENGKGKAAKNKTGGTYLQANTYIAERKVSAYLSDLDMFIRLNRVAQYIAAWEHALAAALIQQGKHALKASLAQA